MDSSSLTEKLPFLLIETTSSRSRTLSMYQSRQLRNFSLWRHLVSALFTEMADWLNLSQSWFRQASNIATTLRKRSSFSFGFGGAVSSWYLALNGYAMHLATIRYKSFLSWFTKSPSSQESSENVIPREEGTMRLPASDTSLPCFTMGMASRGPILRSKVSESIVSVRARLCVGTTAGMGCEDSDESLSKEKSEGLPLRARATSLDQSAEGALT